VFANFFNLITRRPGSDYEQAFVRDVQVTRKPKRNLKLERLLWWGWFLILIKSVVIWWACTHYPVPFHPAWIVLPTIAFAVLVTAVYLSRR
jgi:hypothetical protein